MSPAQVRDQSVETAHQARKGAIEEDNKVLSVSRGYHFEVGLKGNKRGNRQFGGSPYLDAYPNRLVLGVLGVRLSGLGTEFAHVQ